MASSAYGKKFVVIGEEEYERLKKRPKILNPTKREFFESEKQMKDVLNESEIPVSYTHLTLPTIYSV